MGLFVIKVCDTDRHLVLAVRDLI